MSSETLILIVKIHKDGSVFRIEDRERTQIAKSIFGPIIYKVKFCKVLWSKIIPEANGLSRRN